MDYPFDENERLEWVEKYVLHQLDADEIIVFERWLTEYPTLQAEVEAFRRTHQYMRQAFVRRKVSQTLKSLQESQTLKAPAPTIVYARTVAYWAIGVLSLFMVLITFLPVRLPTPVVGLIEERDVSPTGLTTAQQQLYSQFSKGEQQMIARRFSEAEDSFETLLKRGNLSPYFKQLIQWRLVIIYLVDNRPKLAAKTMSQFESQPKRLYEIDMLTYWQAKWQIWVKNSF